jgi:putative transposase
MCNAITTGTNARQVVHRRNDGTACFFNDEDYLVYLDLLQEAAARHHCAIHCYVLMPDRAQLLVSPEAEHRLPLMMRCAGGRYAEYVHYIYQLHGAFWEHGAKFSLIEGGRDVLASHRAIESAPARAGLVTGPSDYRWSSYHHHALGREDALVCDHPAYLGLGAGPRERQAAYRKSFDRAPEVERLAGREQRRDSRYPLAAGCAAAA